ncbi:MAG: hypothetical protein FIA99_03695 [Ruminiclostridium sp.]|nr:hypothetical protein [Ruminiclostridium sp.]
MVLKSYMNLKGQLTTAYKTIEVVKSDKADLDKGREEIEGLNSALSEKNKLLEEQINLLKEGYDKASRGNADISGQLEELKRQFSELKKKNKELVDDNIALQNSLKMAASVGVKPQSFSIFENLEPRDNIIKGKYIGRFLGTAYTPSIEECGNNKGITNSGKPIVPGVTVAIDTKYWPFGTVFYIKGLGYAVAMDTGSAVKGKYRFDFSVLDKKFAHQLGSRKWDVYLVKLGKGNISHLKL